METFEFVMWGISIVEYSYIFSGINVVFIFFTTQSSRIVSKLLLEFENDEISGLLLRILWKVDTSVGTKYHRYQLLNGT